MIFIFLSLTVPLLFYFVFHSIPLSPYRIVAYHWLNYYCIKFQEYTPEHNIGKVSEHHPISPKSSGLVYNFTRALKF
jgi:hypothetical protein